MKLSDFVATTLNEIVDGVKSAQEYASKSGAIINAQYAYVTTEGKMKQSVGANQLARTTIDFDIMLTIGQDDKGQGGVGVFAAAFGAGVKGENRDYVESATRVKFQIVAQLPLQK